MSRVVSLDKKLYLKFSLFTQADDIMVRVTGFPWSASSVLGGIAMFSLVSLPAKENQGLTSGRVKPQWLLCEFERSKKKDWHPHAHYLDTAAGRLYPGYTHTSKNTNKPQGADQGCRDAAVVRALAFHQCGPGSIPRLGIICGLSLLVLYSAPRVFLRVLRFPLSSKTNNWLDLLSLLSPVYSVPN